MARYRGQSRPYCIKKKKEGNTANPPHFLILLKDLDAFSDYPALLGDSHVISHSR